jgi:hypothetical protein
MSSEPGQEEPSEKEKKIGFKGTVSRNWWPHPYLLYMLQRVCRVIAIVSPLYIYVVNQLHENEIRKYSYRT